MFLILKRILMVYGYKWLQKPINNLSFLSKNNCHNYFCEGSPGTFVNKCLNCCRAKGDGLFFKKQGLSSLFCALKSLCPVFLYDSFKILVTYITFNVPDFWFLHVKTTKGPLPGCGRYYKSNYNVSMNASVQIKRNTNS